MRKLTEGIESYLARKARQDKRELDRAVVACLIDDEPEGDPEAHLGDDMHQDILWEGDDLTDLETDWGEPSEILPADWDAFTEE